MMNSHTSVLLAETMNLLSPKKGERILDVTLGLGGHSAEMMNIVGTTGSLIALDADEANIELAKQKLGGFGKAVTITHANFRQLPDCLPADRRQFDVILADLGLSSPHLDDPSRGFSFRSDSPLDMRFDRTTGMTAAMLLASLDRNRIINIFRDWGELPSSSRLTDAIIAARTTNPVRTTKDLSAVAESVFGYKAPRYLPQIFQALRIAVNDELGALQHLLSVAPTLLASGGRLAIISFHSLEDALVKNAFRDLCRLEKDPFTGADIGTCECTVLTKKPIKPSENEVAANPRSRSACLRAIARRPMYDTPRPTC